MSITNQVNAALGNNKGITIKASANAGNARIRIVDYIGAEGSDEAVIRSTIDGLIAQQVQSAEVYINSAGGSVFVATEIVNQLKRIPNVTIIVGALIASAATYICAHFYTKIASNTQVMIHKPILGISGNTSEISSKLRLLENITSDYKLAYAQKTKKTEKEIEQLWANGDYWMNAQEAKTLGFVDEVIGENTAITEQDALLLAAYSAPVKWQQFNTNTIPAPAAAIATPAGRNNWTIQDYLDNDPEALNVMAATDPVRFMTLNDAHYAKAMAMAYPGSKPAATIATPGGRDNWTIEDYLENDPEALNVMAKADPVRFKALNDVYYKGL